MGTISHHMHAKDVVSAPSSAAAERIFSLLNNSFSSQDQQESALEDYVQLSVMLQYNY